MAMRIARSAAKKRLNGLRKESNPLRSAFAMAIAFVAAVTVVSIIMLANLQGGMAQLAGVLPAAAAIGALVYMWITFKPIFMAVLSEYRTIAALKGAERTIATLDIPVEPGAGLMVARAATAPSAAETLAESADSTKLSRTDQLTSLSNKLRMIEKFYRLTQANEGGKPTFAVALMNLDGMKPINDLFGHAGGNEVLKQCAMRLAAAVEADGFIYRYQGDEFAFIFPGISDVDSATEKGRLLLDVLLAPFDLEGSSVRLSASFGFAIYPHAGDTFDLIMANADTALYHSKRNGRGKATVYTDTVEATVRENARIEQALRNAIDNNSVRPHFQPIISLTDGGLLGFESLARWTDAELGPVSPGRFIPLAEERGIIAPLTESLLWQAARAAADWPEPLFLSFNLSSTQLIDVSTAKNITDMIKRAGLPPHRLEIEVTETAMMSDPQTAATVVDELHEAGIRVAMDDFGTGQSSLGRLRELKLDKVKIDRSFIMAIGADKPAEHIVRAILEMCAGLELTVVAEGIEEIGQAEALKRYGCHAAQGYLFGKPQDALRTMAYIRQFMRSIDDTESSAPAVFDDRDDYSREERSVNA